LSIFFIGLKSRKFAFEVGFVDGAGEDLIDIAVAVNEDRRRQTDHLIGFGRFAAFIQHKMFSNPNK